MQQIVDLHNDADFQALGVELVSLAFDSPAELASGAAEYGVRGVPLLSDTDHKVSEAYGVLEWAIDTGEPGHTFVLVDSEGTIAWVRDYGAPEKPDRTMYVEPSEIVDQVRAALGS
jgi:peroxiredoxin